MIKPGYILASLLILMIVSCRKESFITGSDAVISISADTLHFDTLFTTAGSVTQALKLYNNNNRKLLISAISVGGGAGSYFRINADGFAGPEVKDLEMAANDSLYVFVTVKVDPGSAKLPYLIQDSIKILFNGNEKFVQLDAWGQNATFLRSGSISANTIWTNDKPYVILGGLQVNENVVLTIQKGTKIFLHADAPLLVDGTLNALGEKTDSMQIVFSGDRLDDPYRNYPGAWPGIYFRAKSRDNILKHVIIKNAYQGIVVQGLTVNSNPRLYLDKCIIDNCYDAGLIGVQTDIKAENCLITNCGKNIQLVSGGNYELTQCTVAAYSNVMIAHKDPVLTVANFILQGNVLTVGDLNASFKNCIFWGDNGIVGDEVVVAQDGSGIFNVDFKNCLWKVANAPGAITSSGIISNQDPGFVNTDTRNGIYDFHLDKNSPALGAGINVGWGTDLDENGRDLNFPDLGAFEATF
jgi:hypothetical protein